ncbi:MAG: TolC family protein, partial [Zoogloea sp.]|nr:TolC family protein [Zoogloea sp.]
MPVSFPPRFTVLLAGISMLGGCAFPGPPAGVGERQPHLASPAAWANTAAATPASNTRRAELAAWWRQLGDPLLASLVDEAESAAPDLRSAAARLRQARASRDLAVAGLFPSVGLSASGQRYRNSAATSIG